ncbi:unnamed protein product [Rotaria sp. Silwood1]|nr:unnamed protein product [Rotaria sp. Silwood1]
MPHCIILSILSTQRLISNETNLNDIETTPNTIYFSTTDIRDLLRFIIFISEIIYIHIYFKKKSFLSCETDQIISWCTLSKTLLSIFEYLCQQHG